MMLSAHKLITVAQVGAVVGVKGELKLHVFAEDPRSVMRYQRWYIQAKKKQFLSQSRINTVHRARTEGAAADLSGSWHLLEDVEIRVHGGGFLIRIDGCQDRDLAKRYTHALLAVEREALPALNKGEYYWVDLEGLCVLTTERVKLGIVDHLFSTGANDVLVIKGEKERLLPYIADVVKSVDLAKGEMIVDWDLEF